ncbi:hypothetical protein HK100_008781 [Physocladia obscura]|uniref:NAD(P)-binding domain-containing protein n=1 Tax=Physocladia obscura TaxID=109957 RepID=A0AAD5T9R8_9FUNG|nr:hypothetical protein HK100_008781 [Physocladia obscura]
MVKILVLGATGGLGRYLAQEALSRRHTVSVLVRNPAKFSQMFGSNSNKFANVFEGDGTNATVLAEATKNIDVVVSSIGVRPDVASTAAKALLANNKLGKFVQVAGSTNVLSSDGVALNWTNYVQVWPGAQGAYKSHQAVIDAIKATGVNYVVFCPSVMQSVGSPSFPKMAVRVNRPSGDFVSYEDAAVVMIDAAEVSDWDGQLITSATERN